MSILQFAPADREPDRLVITKEVFFRARDLLSPNVSGEKTECAWQYFHAMKRRIECPRRRRGPYCWRIPKSLTLVPDPLSFEGEMVDVLEVQ